MIDEIQRLAALRGLELLDTPPDADYDRIVHLAAVMLDAPIALFNLIDTDRQWFKACVGTDLDQTDRNVSICTYIIDHKSEDPLAVDDIDTDPRFADHPLAGAGTEIHGYLGKGIKAAGGEIVGTLCVIDRRRRHWTEQDRNAITDLAVFAEQLIAKPNHDNIAKALQHSATRESVLLATVQNGLVIHDASGRIVQWNPAAERLLGLTGDELSGQTSTDLRWAAKHPNGTPWPGDTHPAMEAIATGHPVRESMMGVNRPDGTDIWLSISSAPITEDGTVTGAVTSFTDIARINETNTAATIATGPETVKQHERRESVAALRPHLEHFALTMTDVRATLEAEVALVREILDELTLNEDLVAVVAARPMSDERDRLTTSIMQLEEARRVARAHLFDALNKHGLSIGEIARSWGISRQLASRIIRDKNLDTDIAPNHNEPAPLTSESPSDPGRFTSTIS